jgi:hypothetical protein
MFVCWQMKHKKLPFLVQKFAEIYSFGSGRNRSKSEEFANFGCLVSTGIPDTAFLSFMDKL